MPSRSPTLEAWWGRRVAHRIDARDAVILTEAELDHRVVSVGAWLWLAADTFFFAAWWFSFFYLRALNTAGRWNLHHLHPSRAYGIAILVCVLGSAGATWLAAWSARGPNRALWRAGIAACLFQGFGMWHLGFGLTQGGYASVFAGLTGAWLIQLLGAVAWLATVVVQGRPSGDTVVRPHSAATFGWILVFLAAVGVINYLLLYLVK